MNFYRTIKRNRLANRCSTTENWNPSIFQSFKGGQGGKGMRGALVEGPIWFIII